MEAVAKVEQLKNDAAPKDDAEKKPKASVIKIPAPRFSVIAVKIVGDAPLVMNRFSKKAQDIIAATQAAGDQPGKRRARAPKDFKALYEESMHHTKEGWVGIPCSAFRAAAVSACRLVNFKMTIAKLSLSVLADGVSDDNTPLVRITKGKPHMDQRYGRNANRSVDLRARAMWEPGWEAVVRFRYDEGQFSRTDVLNLIMRIGAQVGLLEGRPDSKDSPGLGWGTFVLGGKVDVEVSPIR